MGSELFTVPEAAVYINASERWVRRAVFEGTIPYVKLRRLVRIEKAALDRLIDQGRHASREHN